MIHKQTEKALSLLGLDYTKNDNCFRLCCPFASDPKSSHKNGNRNASFLIYPERGFALCFGCHLKFDLFEFFETYSNFIKKQIDLEYIEFYVPIVEEHEDVNNIILNESILSIFKKDHILAKEYLFSRDMDIDNLPFDILFDGDYHNIVVPVRGNDNKLLGATGRKIDNSFGSKHHHYFGMTTSKSLLGLEKQDAKYALVVEGMTDLLNAYDKITRLNLDMNVYATLTCSMSDWQARELTDLSKPVFLGWDQDSAGKHKRETAFNKLSGCLWLYDVFWDFKDEGGKLKDIGNMTEEEFSILFRQTLKC